MARVGLEELLVGQRGDGAGVAAGLVAVGRRGEETALELLVEDVLGVGERALHLVEDDAVVGEAGLVALALDFQVPALLLKDPRPAVDRRVEHRVQIDAHEFLEVGRVRGGDGVHGLVGEGERVQEGLHRGLEQVHERLLDRVGVRAAQDRVLEDVEDARVVRGRGLERNREGLVVVGAGEPQQAGAARLVAHDVAVAADLGHGLGGDDGEAGVARAVRERGGRLGVVNGHDAPYVAFVR